MASLPAAGTTHRAPTAPLKRRGRPIPMVRHCFERIDDGLGRLRMLSAQRPPRENALHRFGHVQPGGPEWGIQRHDAVGDQPEDELRCGFRANVATDSTGSLPPFPREGCH